MNFLWHKIEEKFEKIAIAFKFFSGKTTPNKISFNDFVIGLENLRVKMETKDIMDAFAYLDRNGDGYIDYCEFCLMTEEKRRGIDPFDKSAATKTQKYFES